MHRQLGTNILLLFLAASLALASVAPAASTDVPPPEIPTLPPVTVVAAPEEHLTGSSSLSRETIDALPRGNGSVNELLDVLPGVQFAEEARSSQTAGEILPPAVSISGGRTYQNNFTIDGLGNNSLLDPNADDPKSSVSVPGHPQEIFLDASLVEEVTVYDHNVPASYGGFTGGAVDARTRNPAPEFGGALHYRTTSDRWTELHVDDEDEEDFEASRSHLRQPHFEKHDAGISLDIPLGRRGGLLASYQRSESTIPLRWLGEHKKQRRRNENFFLKYALNLPSGVSLDVTALHAPYRADYFYPDAVDGDITIDGGGSSFATTYQRPLPLGDLRLLAAYRVSENSRRAAPHLRRWLYDLDPLNPGTLLSTAKPWGAEAEDGVSTEGSVGSLESEQQGWQARADFTAAGFATGPLRHAVSAGIDFERVRGTLERPEENHIYFGPKYAPTVTCEEGAIDCIAGEQYFTKRFVYEPDEVVATIDQYHLYLEDRMRLGRLELRPGVRFSYDDFMKNRNTAPRLAASYDLLGDGATVLVAGYNRYYGKTLLTYKLREGSRPYRYEWRTLAGDTPTAWGPLLVMGVPLAGRGYRYSDLKTPYTDETVFGLDQRLFGGVASLRYIERQGDDEFATHTVVEPKVYELNNNGHSRHQEYRFAWERRSTRHFLALNATYQETESSNEKYTSELDLEDLEKQVVYRGEVVYRSDLPRNDYNRPWTANLTYSVRLPLGFAFTNVTKYRSGYRAPADTRVNTPEGLDIYARIKQPESWIFDWRIDWQKGVGRGQALGLTLEVLNVFDRKVPAGPSGDALEPGSSTAGYELGRQFWAGAEYRF